MRAGLLPGWSGPTARAGRAGSLRGLDRAATARNHTARAGPVACSVGRAAVARVQGERSPVRELWWAHEPSARVLPSALRRSLDALGRLVDGPESRQSARAAEDQGAQAQAPDCRGGRRAAR